MPVEITEYVKIMDRNGIERQGKGVGADLVAVEDEDGELYFGALAGLVKVRTKIICDLGTECTRGQIDENFKTNPKTIEFDDEGKGPEQFIKEVSEVVISSDYRGQKLVFCCYECSSKYYRKQSRTSNVVEFPAGKGKRTFDTQGSVVLQDK